MLNKSALCIFQVSLLLTLASTIFGQMSIDTLLKLDQMMVYFDSDSDIINEEYKAKIDSLSSMYIDDPQLLIRIEAHTDEVGSDDYNIRLSKRREGSVRQLFLENNIPDSVLFSKHFGESRLLTKTVHGLASRLNRRAEITVFKKKNLIRIKGKVIDIDSKLPLVADINLSTNEFTSTSKSDSSGFFSILSPLGERVNLEVLALNYFIETNALLISEKHRDLILKVPLPKLELGRNYLFKNMLFMGNRSLMLNSSERTAYQLKRFMDLHPEVCIEIEGHINLPSEDSVGRSSSHFELSVARANEIRNQLIQEGVQEERILARGYGNWRMKFPKAKFEKEMALNRRVEIKIITCEEAALQENDVLSDLLRYRKSNFRRFYEERLVETEISSDQYRLRILLQVASMIKQGMDPSKYTYKEIFDAYPNLPEAKEE